MQIDKEQYTKVIILGLIACLVIVHVLQINTRTKQIAELENQLTILEQFNNHLKIKKLNEQTSFRQVQYNSNQNYNSNLNSNDKKIFEKNSQYPKVQDTVIKNGEFDQEEYRKKYYKKVHDFEVPTDIQTALDETQGNTFKTTRNEKDYYKMESKQEGNSKITKILSRPTLHNTGEHKVNQQYEYHVTQVPSQNRRVTSNDPDQIDNDSYEVAYSKDTDRGKIIQSEMKGDFKRNRQEFLNNYVPFSQTIQLQYKNPDGTIHDLGTREVQTVSAKVNRLKKYDTMFQGNVKVHTTDK